MCIGLPLRAIEVLGQQAVAQGRGRRETVDLRLVGAVEPGQWLLVFNGAARECLDGTRAAEINAALDLLEQGLAGQADAQADPGFALPSSMSLQDLAALAGRT